MKEPKRGTGILTRIREKAGRSNAFKKREGPFAGPDKTYPIPDIAHARNALARAHFSDHPEAIRKKVESKYPSLKKSNKK